MIVMMVQHSRRPLGAGQVPVTPAHQGQDHRVQVPAGLSQAVLKTRRMLGVLPAIEDSRPDQRAQPGGEGVPRRSGLADDLIEPAIAQEHFPDGEQGPLLPDDLERARYGAHSWRSGSRRHDASIPS
jgi:hypothetical protein